MPTSPRCPREKGWNRVEDGQSCPSTREPAPMQASGSALGGTDRIVRPPLNLRTSGRRSELLRSSHRQLGPCQRGPDRRDRGSDLLLLREQPERPERPGSELL